MKKMLLFVVFAVVLVGTLSYYEDPKYYHKQLNRQVRKYRKQFGCWQETVHDMMPF